MLNSWCAVNDLSLVWEYANGITRSAWREWDVGHRRAVGHELISLPSQYCACTQRTTQLCVALLQLAVISVIDICCLHELQPLISIFTSDPVLWPSPPGPSLLSYSFNMSTEYIFLWFCLCDLPILISSTGYALPSFAICIFDRNLYSPPRILVHSFQIFALLFQQTVSLLVL